MTGQVHLTFSSLQVWILGAVAAVVRC